jgi:hypothetical protein
MHEATIANAAAEIVDTAAADLAGIGCTPIDRASALLAAGLAELDEADDLAGVLAVHRLVLEHVCGTLQALDVAATATRH